MKRSEKQQIIDAVKEQINSYSHFYLTDIEGLDAETTSALRRMCFESEVKLVVVKNTLLRRAIEESDKEAEGLYEVLKGNTAMMFTETGNAPAKLIKKLLKEGNEKPLFKGAYVEESIYVGDDQLDVLVNIKSKNELIADVVALLQSPVKTVMSQLQSGGQTITGILKTLSEKE